MRRIVGAVFQSLDGVMQAPGGPDEDPTGGFAYGGWATSFFDDAMMAVVGTLFAPPYALLLGRRTWDIFAAHWPHAQGEDAAMGEALGAADKYVLTRGRAPLGWRNGHRLADMDAVAALKAGDGPDLLIQGSSTLYAPLLAAGLLDRLTIMTFPVVLGGGKRVWDGVPAGALRLADSRTSGSGVSIVDYEPAGAVPIGSFAMGDGSPEEADRQRRMREGRW